MTSDSQKNNDHQRSHTQRTRDKELTLAVKIFGCGFTPTACDEDIVTVIVKTLVKICDKDAAPTIVTACDSTLFTTLNKNVQVFKGFIYL
jgi:hypothetical protein